MKHANASIKTIKCAKKVNSWNPRTCICRNSKYLKRAAEHYKIACEKIINCTDSVSTIVTNTASINLYKRNVQYETDYYIWIIIYYWRYYLLSLLFVIIIQNIDLNSLTKWRIMNYKKSVLKIKHVLLFRWHNEIWRFWFW